MGCIPLVESLGDIRMVAIVAFWCGTSALVAYCILGKPGQFKRCLYMNFVIFFFSVIITSTIRLEVVWVYFDVTA